MADAAVEFLLENLQRLQLYHADLISNVKNQVKKLENDLQLFKAFLRDSTKKRCKDESLRELVGRIRDVVYQAEDIIDAIVTQASVSKSKSYFLRAFQSKPVDLFSIVNKDVEAVAAKIRDIYGEKNILDFSKFSLAADDSVLQENEALLIRQENVVGFEDEVNTLISCLHEETDRLDVISIIGLPGLGKSTVAGKIFHNREIQYEFPTRIWLNCSENFTRKNVFLTILSEFIRLTDEICHKTDYELARMVYAHLETVKFLIVIDDIWTAEDWNILQIALPKSNKLGKVLITSRIAAVARHANHRRLTHQLRFLTREESWLLLQNEIFSEPNCPPELEVLGKLIAEQCDRLPLAIVVISGILHRKLSAAADMSARRNAWKKISESLSMHLATEDPMSSMEKIIALSYDKLPYHLRACLIYFGVFPKDFEIPVWKLIRMWIAEGFIQRKSGFSLEKTAESYLDDLINRKLVRIDKMSRDGKVKTCRIHAIIRDFCIIKAENDTEKFLREVKISSEGTFDPQVAYVQKHRRLSVHSNIVSFISSRPFGPEVRSLICFSSEEIVLPIATVSTIPAAFKLLRVLEAKPIIFHKFHSDMYQLVHLRYIAISFKIAYLPEYFSKLWNIQTLIVDTPSRTLEIKADIWKMMELRHLKTNASAILPKTGKTSKGGENLQTLGMISPRSCTIEVFDRVRNMKKLGICGRLAILLDAENGSFDNFRKLSNLEKLKLLNDVFPSQPSEGELRGLPPPYQFPPKLRSLTLSNTSLDWKHMSILGMLENLKVLKLKDKAFMGEYWETVDGGFCHLEVLLIECTDLLFWKASEQNFPRLRRLELRNCEELQEIPIALAAIPAFQMLDLYHTKFAAASAKKIQKAKESMQEGKSDVCGFKLSIFPPNE